MGLPANESWEGLLLFVEPIPEKNKFLRRSRLPPDEFPFRPDGSDVRCRWRVTTLNSERERTMNRKHEEKPQVKKSCKPEMQPLTGKEKKEIAGGWSFFRSTSLWSFQQSTTYQGISINHNETLVEDAE